LTDAFYFYDGKFALAFKDEKFYFIDKNGDAVDKLRKWSKAEQFDNRGFAKIKNDAKDNFLLDTMGNIYPVAYRLGDLNENITALDLSETSLDTFPLSIITQTQLELIFLSGNSEKPNNIEIPTKINVFKKLSYLYLNHCNIKKLPKEIGELKNLFNLHMTGNQLTTLPKEIGELKNLATLNLWSNQLTTLPKEIGELKNLTTLNLIYNKLTELPKEIGELKNLTTLNLAYNKLTKLPKEIGELKNLAILSLAYNQLTELPKEIGELKMLMKLHLSYNQLLTLPKEIGKYEKLIDLQLAQNKLTKIPREIGCLKKLTYLHLGSNELIELPKEIGNLNNLITLNIWSNELIELPKEICKLKNLLRLDIMANPLSEVEEKKIKKLLPNCKILFMRMENSKKATMFFTMKDYQNAFLYQKKALLKDSNNYNTWFNFSFYALFVKEYKNAIFAAKKTLEIDPSQKRVETNLALGYLLNNEWSEAEMIYFMWKGKKFKEEDEKTCDEIFLQDIQDLEAAGITHHSFAKVYEIFSREAASMFFDRNEYKKAYFYQSRAIIEDSSDYILWFDLSYYALFSKEYKESIFAARKTLGIDPSQVEIEAIIALSYLLDNQWSEAEKVYFKWKGKKFKEKNKKNCNEIFLRDIVNLEAAGIMHPDFAKVRTLLSQ
jgi:Leucine-rich repeat (LRR) protein